MNQAYIVSLLKAICAKQLLLCFSVLHALGPPDTWSAWTYLKAYDSPEVDIPHGLGELPMKVEVQVKVTDSQLGELIFIASGSAQRPTDPTEYYGGVIYKYNAQYVRVMAPGPTGCASNCNGGLVYLGDTGYQGLTPGDATGLYRDGHVRVRAWKMCTYSRPTKIVDLLDIDSGVGFLTVPLSATSKFDMVIVKVNVDNGWITDALESVHSTVNWGSGANDITLTSATVRIFAWSFSSETPIKVTKTVTVTPSSTDIYEMDLEPNYDPTTPNISITVEANANDLPDEDDWSYPITGSAVTSGKDSSISYGSIIYAFNDEHIMFWAPAKAHGCSLQMSDDWGDGAKSFCTKRPSITIRYFETDIDDLPCDTNGCSGMEAGPFCDCSGTGFESQFCDVPVPCLSTPESATFGFINGSYESYFGSVVYYACINTYAWRSGDMERTCGADGQWNGTAPICDKFCGGCRNRVLSEIPSFLSESCGEPESPTGAHRTNLGITEGVIAEYECDRGHEYVSGDMERACLIGGTWNGTAPVCQRVSCGAPLSGSDSTLQVTTYLYGDSATYTCTVGYEDVTKAGNQYLVTTRTIECQETKAWSDVPLSCTIKTCDMPDNTTNATTIVTGLSYLSRAIVVCDDNFFIKSGQAQRYCNENGQWEGQKPECQEGSVVFIDPSGPNTGGSGGQGNSGGNGTGSGGSSGNSSTGVDPLDLRVDPKDTVRYKQSLYSPYNDTPSHVAIGVTGVIVLIAVCGYICSLDYIRHVRVGGKVKVIHGMKENPYAVKNKPPKAGKTPKENELQDLENVNHVYK
ncbi:hypothetical protein FSP39_004255 [Pinctada imbricata]|uniref:Sushi domain-containing protein n=1 Tax=Pinctada imbricata TaxID=66713 RepID=A0AA88Y5D8_PINIB|nr:hypothetical protein FSP39_004255 [Pinctada imbricata]